MDQKKYRQLIALRTEFLAAQERAKMLSDEFVTATVADVQHLNQQGRNERYALLKNLEAQIKTVIEEADRLKAEMLEIFED